MAKKVYSLFQKQTVIVKEHINEILGKEFIHLSKSPYTALVLIAKKPEGGL